MKDTFEALLLSQKIFPKKEKTQIVVKSYHLEFSIGIDHEHKFLNLKSILANLIQFSIVHIK